MERGPGEPRENRGMRGWGCYSYVPLPFPHLPYHWARWARVGLVQSPLGLETDLLRLQRNEPGFPVLTSLLIRL